MPTTNFDQLTQAAPEIPRDTLDHLQRTLAANPFLQETVLINGTATNLMHQPPPQTQQRISQTTRTLANIDPRYGQNDLDLNKLVPRLSPNSFDRLTTELNQRNIGYSYTNGLLITQDGNIFSTVNALDRHHLLRIYQQIISHAPNPQDYYLRQTSLSSGEPYLIIGPNASVQVPLAESTAGPDIKNTMPGFIELFVKTVDYSQITPDLPASEVHALISQAQSTLYGSEATALIFRQTTTLNRLDFRPNFTTQQNLDLEKLPHDLSGLYRLTYQLYESAYSQLPLPTGVADWINQFTQEHASPLIAQPQSAFAVRRLWRKVMSQIAFDPSLTDAYTKIGLLPLFLGAPNTSVTLPSTLGDVYRPDLSLIPPKLIPLYQAELSLPLTSTPSSTESLPPLPLQSKQIAATHS